MHIFHKYTHGCFNSLFSGSDLFSTRIFMQGICVDFVSVQHDANVAYAVIV